MALQVWLPFTDGTLKQQGLNNASATVGGTVNLTNAGKLGKCATIGTAAGGITLPASTMTSFTECSIAFWIKIISWNTSYATFFQAGLGSTPWNNYIFGILRNNQNSNLCFTLTNSNGSSSQASYVTSNLNTGQWYHLVFTYKAGTICTYIDGLLDKTYSTTYVPNFAGITHISIGRCTNNSGYQTNCGLNDFRIYDHCLSKIEVKQLSQGLVLHYPLNRQGFGQENLLLNTSLEKTGASNSAQWFRWNVANPMLATNHIYTLSFDAKMSNGTDVFYIGWANNDSTQITMQEGVKVTNEYKRYSFTGQTTKTNINAFVISNYKGYGRGNGNNTTGVLSIKNIKLEEGSIATPWCPNSSDTLATTIGLNGTTEYDISGFCNNGTRVGTFEWSSDTPKYSVSTVFNASHPDYIKIPYTNYAIQEAKEMTWSIWAYDDDWSTYSGRIYSCTEGGGVNIEESSSTLNWAVNMYTAADYSTYAYQGYCSINKASLSSGWHMFTWVYTTTGTKVYVDGVLKSTVDINSYGIHFANTALYLGAEAQGETTTTGYYLTGKLSDFRIYATALSAADVKSLYQNNAAIDSDGTIHGKIRD